MNLAKTNGEKATALYQRTRATALSQRCQARTLFYDYWIRNDVKERNLLIEDCIRLASKAATMLEAPGERNALAETYVDLLTYRMEAFWLVQDWKSLSETFATGVETGKKALALSDGLDNPQVFLETINLTLQFMTNVAFFAAEPTFFTDSEEFVKGLVAKAAELSRSIGTQYARSLAYETSALLAHFLTGARYEAVSLFETALSNARTLKDSYSAGRLGLFVAINAFWEAAKENDVSKRKELYEKTSRMALDAVDSLKVSMSVSLMADTYGWAAEGRNYLALEVEIEPEKKILQLKKAEDLARRGLELSPGYGIGTPGHSLAKALYLMSTLEARPQERARLLREALPLREKSVRIVDTHENPRSWDRGVMRNWLALIKSELSKVEQDPQVRLGLLEGAANDMEECIGFCANWANLKNTSDFMIATANYLEWYGDILLELHKLTQKTESLSRAINVYEDAISFFSRAGQTVRIPPTTWRIAKVHDTDGNYQKSAESFKRAAENYRTEAEKPSGLSPIFRDLAIYMEAWSKIEQGRVHHTSGAYSQSSENYTGAAELLRETTGWNHLTKHYAGCALLETGEALSSQEKHVEAAESFRSSSEAFRAAKADLETYHRKSNDTQDRRELDNWLKITEGRETYALGRTKLEEARVMDRKGDETESIQRYESAATTFRGLLGSLEQPRGELQTLALFCEAWATMKQAELKASPDLYARSAGIFASAAEHATTEKYRFLALANSSMCGALESGTRFRLSQDTALYSEIKKHLHTAAEYYEHGAFENAAEWTHAAQRMFDALAYLADAEVEREPRKKAESFRLAEKNLEHASKLYDKAGFSKRRDEATRQLKRVREEKEILLTPLDALAQNPAVSGESAPSVTLVRDQAPGLERFDEANVVGSLEVHEKEVEVGSRIDLSVEMANVGKTAATLLKLTNVFPEGFQTDSEKIEHRADNGFIDMKGRRLEYLKTHQVKLVLKALRKGSFELKPQVHFVDQKGNYKSFSSNQPP